MATGVDQNVENVRKGFQPTQKIATIKSQENNPSYDYIISETG